MIVADFINIMNWQKPLKTAVLSELCRVTKLQLFDLYSANIDTKIIKESSKKVVTKLYNKNTKDIGRLYNTHTPHKTILKLSDQNKKAYQKELTKINEVK